MELPATYYDVLLHRDPALFEYVRKDIAGLNASHPFGSTDDFSKEFDNYLRYTLQQFADGMSERLNVIGLAQEEGQAALDEAMASKDVKLLAHARHADYLAVSNFELFGRKTLYVNDNLVHQLAHTSLETEADYLRLPFPSCLFVFTSPLALRALYAIHSTGADDIDLQAPVSVFGTSHPAAEGGRKLMFACWHAKRGKSYFHVKRELLIRPGWTITKTLRTDWSDIYAELGRSGELTTNEIVFGQKGEDRLFYEEGLTFFRIVLNTILYLCSNEPSLLEHLSPHANNMAALELIKSTTKRRKRLKTIAKQSKLDFTEVGWNAQPIIVKKPGVSGGGTESVQGVSERYLRFIVRGHWRHQVHGPVRSERKLIWIKPYYKGPEMAELVNKPYVVR